MSDIKQRLLDESFKGQEAMRREALARIEALEVQLAALRASAVAEPVPTDRQLWEMSCLTRAQLESWTDGDISKHTAGVRKTLRMLFERLDAHPAPAAPVPASVRELATRLLDFIDAEGPSSREWEAISSTAEALRTALASLPAPAAAPSDIERAFQDACDEAGCDYDNEALLMAINALKSAAAPTREEIIEQCAAIAIGWGCQPEGRAAILALKEAPAK